MKKKPIFSILALSGLFLVGCAGTTDTSSSTDTYTDYPYCEDDSEYFVFNEDETLKNAINTLDIGALEEEERDDILDLLGSNDGYANTVSYRLEKLVDYDTSLVLDDERDFTGVYEKNVVRHDALKILIGEYDLFENYYDEEASLEVTTDETATYQVFRNGFCPFTSRYYEIYDFDDDPLEDVAIERVYGTEAYVRKLNLVNGQALALELISEYADLEDSEIFTSLSFAATKYASNANGEVEGDNLLNTSTALRVSIEGSYNPSGEALGEIFTHSVTIVDGMIKNVTTFSGTFELVGATTVYHTAEQKTAVYSVDTIPPFSGTLLNPADFEFTTTAPNL